MKDISYNSAFIAYDDDATWLITYADLMTLLLVFFVLLYSLAFFEKEKYKAKVKTIIGQLEHDRTPKGVLEVFDAPGTPDRRISIEDITGLRSRETTLIKTINRFAQKTGQDKSISTQAEQGKIIITVSGETLFSSGSADLNPSAFPVFNQLIETFDAFPEYNINIKGHTDNIPISTRDFPSNWELSAIRATTVIKYLVSRGVAPQRLTATGYGDIMPQVANTTEENRARNRRVEFVLEKKETNN